VEFFEVELEAVSVVPGWPVAECPPAGDDGDSFGFLGLSNSIGPRALGRSGSVDAALFGVTGVAGPTCC
jgi:hypothetical protein